MPFEKTIAQALDLIRDQYEHLGRSLVRLRFRLDISSTDVFCIFLVEDNNETKIESGFGTSYDRVRYAKGSYYFRIFGKDLITEAFFLSALEAFRIKVEATVSLSSVVYYDLELEYNVFTIIAHNEQGFLNQITHAIHPEDHRIPDRSFAPFCLSKPRIDK